MKTENILKERNLKSTEARKALLKVLLHVDRPVCFEDIKDRLEMDKTTFYRNISKFEEKSIVSGFESNDKKRYYELSQAPHMHFVCDICHHIECLHNPLPVMPEGCSVSDVVVKGRCKNCNA
jgi:Fur family transcriptional regulator, ferric uptake regulator